MLMNSTIVRACLVLPLMGKAAMQLQERQRYDKLVAEKTQKERSAVPKWFRWHNPKALPEVALLSSQWLSTGKLVRGMNIKRGSYRFPKYMLVFVDDADFIKYDGFLEGYYHTWDYDERDPKHRSRPPVYRYNKVFHYSKAENGWAEVSIVDGKSVKGEYFENGELLAYDLHHYPDDITDYLLCKLLTPNPKVREPEQVLIDELTIGLFDVIEPRKRDLRLIWYDEKVHDKFYLSWDCNYFIKRHGKWFNVDHDQYFNHYQYDPRKASLPPTIKDIQCSCHMPKRRRQKRRSPDPEPEPSMTEMSITTET